MGLHKFQEHMSQTLSTSGTSVPLKVAIVSKTFFYVPLWAAAARGAFERAGIDLNVELLGNASQAPGLLSGELHVAIATPEAALQNAAEGGPLRVVAGNTGRLSHSLISRRPFPTVSSLRGARVGILNKVEGSFFQLKAMMAHHGLHHPADYEVVETGGVPPRHAALLDGRIDAGLQSIPWNYLAEEAGLNNLGDVVGYVPDWQFVSVNVNREWAAANGGLLTLFLRVLLDSTEWVHTHRSEAVDIAVRELPARQEHAERAWDYYINNNALTRDMSLNHQGLEEVLKVQREAGLLGAGAPRSLESYVETSWLDEARRAAPKGARS
jgi:ABC-type nitrate/sulfonate/bicarbonate transport system substrate-binding protein